MGKSNMSYSKFSVKESIAFFPLFCGIMSSKLYNVNGDLKCRIDLCRKSEIRKFIEASNTIENWLDYIANSFIDKRLSNGFT